MRFRSPGPEPVSLEINIRKTATVGPRFTELDPRFHEVARAKGCIAESDNPSTPVEDSARGRGDMNQPGELRQRQARAEQPARRAPLNPVPQRRASDGVSTPANPNAELGAPGAPGPGPDPAVPPAPSPADPTRACDPTVPPDPLNPPAQDQPQPATDAPASDPEPL